MRVVLPKAHPHMLRHARGYALASRGHDTRALQAYLGHKNIQHTVRYTELSLTRFKDLELSGCDEMVVRGSPNQCFPAFTASAGASKGNTFVAKRVIRKWVQACRFWRIDGGG